MILLDDSEAQHSTIIEAAFTGDIATVRLLLSTSSEEDRLNAIGGATYNRHIEIVRLLSPIDCDRVGRRYGYCTPFVKQRHDHWNNTKASL